MTRVTVDGPDGETANRRADEHSVGDVTLADAGGPDAQNVGRRDRLWPAGASAPTFAIRTVGSGPARVPPVEGAIAKPVQRRYWFHAAMSSFIVLHDPPLTA